ncbi:unnamed protein product [Anisakis simplex]|uniref:Uncharacterized protein n=1 Tax=Anisakis simplex TaxID=6269 RepID=A0A0M3JZF7_ANISI|nr:unnamed protein product [Anisakis simplex]
MEPKPCIGPFQRDYILQRCSTYKSERNPNQSRIDSCAKEKKPNEMNAKQSTERTSITKAKPMRAEELLERHSRTNDTPSNSRTTSSEESTTAKTTRALSDIRFHLAQIEKLVGRNEVLKATLRTTSADNPVTPAQSPAFGSEVSSKEQLNNSKDINQDENIKKLRNALIRVRRLQALEEAAEGREDYRTLITGY